MKPIILVIGGHGKQVSGKFSPKIPSDMSIGKEFTESGRFREWKYNRIIADLVVTKLKSMGYDARNLVPEDDDISLSERVRRVNQLCNKYGSSNVFLVEIHSNAVGNGSEWMNGRGWEAYTTKGKTKSDILAEFLYKRAEQNMPDRKIRKDLSDGDSDKEYNFYVIRKVYCPAVLTENFFYDNKDDLKYITSDEGIHAVTRTHVEGIMDFYNYLEDS